MKVLIIEDEMIAANRLKKLIYDYDDQLDIVGALDSVLESVAFLSSDSVDLIFMDIQLSDGISFEIFEQVEINTPVIFTTAYDEYMLKAFKVNSVDYLLKPIAPDDLVIAIDKFKKLRKLNKSTNSPLNEFLKEYLNENKDHKSRFLVKTGRSFQSIDVGDIAYFISEKKLNFIVTHANKKYIIDQSLEDVIDSLDPKLFFKINRKMIVAHGSVEKVDPYFNNRLILTMKPTYPQEVLVSRSCIKEFKLWMDM